nr:unnamed protein product [Callosobruchus analis]
MCCVNNDDLPLDQPDSHHPALIVTFPNIYTTDRRFEPNEFCKTYNFKKLTFRYCTIL